MKYLIALAVLATTIATTAQAQSSGSLHSYVQGVLLKDCPKITTSVKATNPLFANGKITYTDTHTFTCDKKYAYRYRWAHDTGLYKVYFWNGPMAKPIVVETTNNYIIQMLDPGKWTIQVEHVDKQGNSRFTDPMFVDFNP